MSYLGNAPARSFISFERQVFTIVNSQTAYTLSHSVTNENDIRLVINNVVQEPGSGKAYTATGTTLTLSAALTNGTDEMYCVFLGRATATNAPGAGSVGTAQLAADAVTTAKVVDGAITSAKLASGVGGVDGISSSANATAISIDSSEVVRLPVGILRLQNATTGTADTDGLLIEASGNDVYINNKENADMYFRTNNTDRMRITSAGHVIAPNLNTTGSTGNRYPLYWVHTGTTGSIEPYTGSIRAMKTDINDMGSVDWIHSLTPRSFKFRDYETDEDGNRTYLETTNDLPNTEYGLIAEEVNQVNGSDYILDKQIDEDGTENLKGVLYHNLVPVLLKAVQEQKTKINELEARITTLENA